MIGGPGAFVIPVRDRAQFKEAIRTKLILEIAELTSTARVQPRAGEKAARLLHRRRADVARPLGELSYFSSRATISTCGE